jgi:hypothetical protein
MRTVRCGEANSTRARGSSESLTLTLPVTRLSAGLGDRGPQRNFKPDLLLLQSKAGCWHATHSKLERMAHSGR